MYKHIIFKADKEALYSASQKRAGIYSAIYAISILGLLAICILPYTMHWVSAPKTEPQEAIVLITTSRGFGTGFLIDPTHIMTARHVVEKIPYEEEVSISFQRAAIPFETQAMIAYYREADQSDLKLSGAIKNAGNDFLNQIVAVFATELESDYAILELENEVTEITPLEFAKSSEFPEGPVQILGYGIGDWSSVSAQITSNKFHGNEKLYKIDASGANHGHSGSPILMVNEQGKPIAVVGIYVAGYEELYEELTGMRVEGGEQVGVKIDHVLKELDAQGYDFIKKKEK